MPEEKWRECQLKIMSVPPWIFPQVPTIVFVDVSYLGRPANPFFSIQQIFSWIEKKKKKQIHH